MAPGSARGHLGSAASRAAWRGTRPWRLEKRSVRHGALRHLDLLELRLDFGAAVLEPWRQQQLFAEMLLGFVDREADIAGRHLAQDAARRAAVDRVEIVAVLDLGHVGIAHALEMG